MTEEKPISPKAENNSVLEQDSKKSGVSRSKNEIVLN